MKEQDILDLLKCESLEQAVEKIKILQNVANNSILSITVDGMYFVHDDITVGHVIILNDINNKLREKMFSIKVLK